MDKSDISTRISEGMPERYGICTGIYLRSLFMIQFYIWVTGSDPDINFLRNDKWKKKFILYTENYEEQTQKLIMIGAHGAVLIKDQEVH